MIITVVKDQYGNHANGTTAAARHFVTRMRDKGHEVRIVTCIADKDETNIYFVKEKKFPGFTNIIRSHGMVIAKPNKTLLRKAFEGSDIVYFFLPFLLAKIGKKIADEMGIASFISFHLMPEHITRNIRLGKARILNAILYHRWKKLYNRFSQIHTPSIFLKDILIKKGYSSDIHAISNGIHPDFQPNIVAKPKDFEDKFIIVMSGRLSREKRQETLIKAVAKSKYNSKIQVMLCGSGLRQKALQKLGDKMLYNKPIIKFCSKEELISTLNYADLYVHTSEIETEAIACMEAFACGRVPIISDSKLSATGQFAKYNEYNLFRNKDIKDLAKKIDWFIENPDKLKEMEIEYAEYAKEFSLSSCADKLEEVLIKVIERHKEKKCDF
ncbi:MAG: glycosyltransferase [Firmicutes bacterium]|nr:glycosyltransferase [Bacillota bacterium]